MSMDIDGKLETICTGLGYIYSQETPSAENIYQDGKDGIVVWRNIVEDGTIQEDDRGRISVQRHFQLGLYEADKFDEKGETLNEHKDSMLEKAVALYTEFMRQMYNDFSVERYSPTTFQVGYDKNDANMTYVLMDVFIQDPYTIPCSL